MPLWHGEQAASSEALRLRGPAALLCALWQFQQALADTVAFGSSTSMRRPKAYVRLRRHFPVGSVSTRLLPQYAVVSAELSGYNSCTFLLRAS